MKAFLNKHKIKAVPDQKGRVTQLVSNEKVTLQSEQKQIQKQQETIKSVFKPPSPQEDDDWAEPSNDQNQVKEFNQQVKVDIPTEVKPLTFTLANSQQEPEIIQH